MLCMFAFVNVSQKHLFLSTHVGLFLYTGLMAQFPCVLYKKKNNAWNHDS